MNKKLTTSLQELLDLILNFYSLSFALVTLISAWVLNFLLNLLFVEAFLLSYLIINIGVRGLLAFAGNWSPLFSEDIAEKYGWEKQNSFQKEIAAADGAFALLGLLSYWLRADFWTATIIGTSACWLLSEYANISSALKERKKTNPFYEISSEIFVGMYIDMIMTVSSLIALAIWKGWF